MAPKHRTSALLLSVSTVGLLAAPALALDENAVQETVTVNAYRAASSISSSTKTETPLIETSQSVTVISRDEMDARGVQALSESLRYSAGVLTESQGNDARNDSFYIRGFSDGSWGDNILLDGMRLPPGSDWYRTRFDSWNMERIEVVKGPSAVLYGQVSPGGVVNQASKTPVAGQMQNLNLSVDEYGKYQSALDVGTALTSDGKVLGRFVGLYNNGPGTINDTNQQRWFAAPSLKVALGDRTEIILQAYYQSDSGRAEFALMPYVGTVKKTSGGFISNRTFLGDPKWSRLNRGEATLGWQLTHRLNDNWRISQSARYAHLDIDYRNVQYNGAGLTNATTMPRRAMKGAGGSETYTADTRISGTFTTGPIQHTLLAGFDVLHAQWARNRYFGVVSASKIAIDIFHPVYGTYDYASLFKASANPTLNLLDIGRQDQFGLYAQDQISYGHWRLTLSGRQDWFLNNSYNYVSSVRTKAEDNALTGRAGLLYLFDFGLAPYASYAQSFEPSGRSTSDSYTHQAFSPVTAQQAEIGFKYQPKTIDGLLTISTYELKQQHVATADPVQSHDCGTGAGTCYVETGEARVRGIEAEGRISPIAGLNLIGAITHMDSAITKANDTTKGNDMIRVPQWLTSFWVDYSFGAGWFNGLSLAGGTRFTGRTYGDTANTLDIPSYALWDTALRYDLTRLGIDTGSTRKMLLVINASNIGDKRYVTTCTSSAYCYYGSARLVRASIQIGW